MEARIRAVLSFAVEAVVVSDEDGDCVAVVHGSVVGGVGTKVEWCVCIVGGVTMLGSACRMYASLGSVMVRGCALYSWMNMSELFVRV